jgi:hypothetical protein
MTLAHRTEAWLARIEAGAERYGWDLKRDRNILDGSVTLYLSGYALYGPRPQLIITAYPGLRGTRDRRYVMFTSGEEKPRTQALKHLWVTLATYGTESGE